MNKKILTLAITMFVSATVFVSCKPSTEKQVEARENVEEAKEEVQEAKEDLAIARKEATAAEWEAFKKSGDSIIDKNEARIAELKQKMKKTGNTIDAKYEKNIEALEQKNKDLKLKMKDYKNDANADWQSFKREFNHDMDELGNAFKDLTVNNKK